MNAKDKKRLETFLREILEISIKHRLKIEAWGNDLNPYVADMDTDEPLCSSLSITDDEYTYRHKNAVPIEIASDDDVIYSVKLLKDK